MWKEPHFRERKEIVTLKHPEIGDVPVTVTPFRPSRTPLRVETAGPLLGADNEEVLKDYLHMSQDEIDGLREKGII